MSSPRSSPHDGASDLEHLVQDFEKRAAQSLRAEGATCIETQLQVRCRRGPGWLAPEQLEPFTQ